MEHDLYLWLHGVNGILCVMRHGDEDLVRVGSDCERQLIGCLVAHTAAQAVKLRQPPVPTQTS